MLRVLSEFTVLTYAFLIHVEICIMFFLPNSSSNIGLCHVLRMNAACSASLCAIPHVVHQELRVSVPYTGISVPCQYCESVCHALRVSVPCTASQCAMHCESVCHILRISVPCIASQNLLVINFDESRLRPIYDLCGWLVRGCQLPI